MLRSCGQNTRVSEEVENTEPPPAAAVTEQSGDHHTNFINEALRNFHMSVSAAERKLVQTFNRREKELMGEISELHARIGLLVGENSRLSEQAGAASAPSVQSMTRSYTHAGLAIAKSVTSKSPRLQVPTTPRPKLIRSIGMLMPSALAGGRHQVADEGAAIAEVDERLCAEAETWADKEGSESLHFKDKEANDHSNDSSCELPDEFARGPKGAASPKHGTSPRIPKPSCTLASEPPDEPAAGKGVTAHVANYIHLDHGGATRSGGPMMPNTSFTLSEDSGDDDFKASDSMFGDKCDSTTDDESTDKVRCKSLPKKPVASFRSGPTQRRLSPSEHAALERCANTIVGNVQRGGPDRRGGHPGLRHL